MNNRKRLRLRAIEMERRSAYRRCKGNAARWMVNMRFHERVMFVKYGEAFLGKVWDEFRRERPELCLPSRVQWKKRKVGA